LPYDQFLRVLEKVELLSVKVNDFQCVYNEKGRKMTKISEKGKESWVSEKRNSLRKVSGMVMKKE